MAENSTAVEHSVAQLSSDQRKLLDILLKRKAEQARHIVARKRAQVGDRTHAPVSLAQQRLWFIDELEGGGAAYNIPIMIELHGQLDSHALRLALNALVERHEVLRTVFTVVQGEPVQEILPSQPFRLEIVDLSFHDESKRCCEYESRKSEEASAPFDLHSGPLIRGQLLRMQAGEHALLLTVHHIVFDGWSLSVLIRELEALYLAAVKGAEAPLDALGVQYADYAQWQRSWFDAGAIADQQTYWRTRLWAAPPLLELPTDRTRPLTQSYRGDTINLSLNAHLSAALKAIARSHGMTLFMVLHAAWTLLLSKLTGQDDILIGTPVANRRHTEVEGMIGLFVNMVVLRVRANQSWALRDYLLHVKSVALGAFDNQDMPFEKVVELLRPERSLTRHPIFQVAFALQNAASDVLSLPDLEARVSEIPNGTAKLDLMLALQERSDEIVGTLNYATDLFDRKTIQRWAKCFEVLAESMTMDTQARIGDLSIMSIGERRQVLEVFNQTYSRYRDDLLLHELFERQVECAPHAVALLAQGECLTYSQLHRRANQLAHHLRARGARPEQFVGVFTERGADMIIGMLAILKAGAAYVPLDPSYPSGRIEFMLADTAPVAVLTLSSLMSRLPSGVHAIAMDACKEEISKLPTATLVATPKLSSRNLAYVIYTSGSTGRPKGVVIEHRSAVNLVCWALQAMNPEVFEDTLHSTSINFDLSVYECFVPLAAGGCIRLVNDALALIEQSHPVTLINTVPSAAKALVDAERIPAAVRVINLAGEPLQRDLVDRIFSRSSVRCICNLYGPSETTTYSSWVRMDRDIGFIPTVGRPIANTKIYILDGYLRPVPIGITGEIYIGGEGVARGYLNRPELTSERFLQDPFAEGPISARMYRTGDVGRWRPDGTIEYLGRNDHQVKVRGFRIELGEIEVRLRSLVKDVAVVVREDMRGEKRIVAYIVIDDHATLDPEELRTHLKKNLPEYMVPAAFVQLARLPMTPNGKLDRGSLPAPDRTAVSVKSYEPPESDVEEILASIWRALLQVDRVGRRDNFFELGGHSLQIVQMLERLRRFGLSTQVRNVFEAQTLAELACVLSTDIVDSSDVPANRIPPGCPQIEPSMLSLIDLEPEHIKIIVESVPGGMQNVQEIYPLVPLQEGLLFHHLMMQRSGDTYVLPVVLRMDSRARLNQFVAALQAVIDRHDILRTAILWENLPHPVQVVYRDARLLVEEIQLNVEARAQIEAWLELQQQHMDLGKAPLMKLKVAFDTRTSEAYVLWQVHHICDDATSRRMMLSELAAHMKGAAQRLPPAAPYRDHVAHALAHKKARDSAGFFRARLGDIDEPYAPFGVFEMHSDNGVTAEVCEHLEEALAARIRSHAANLGVSTATLFHAAWAMVVARTSGRADAVFGTVLLGRMQGTASTQRMLGMFINTLPIRLPVRFVSVQELIEHTQREMVELLGHEHASLSEAQRCTGVPGDLPLFTTLLNYRHAFQDVSASWRGLDGIELVGTRTGTNYPIAISVDDLGRGFAVTAQTNGGVSPGEAIAYLRAALNSLTLAMEKTPHLLAGSLQILPFEEWKQVTDAFNSTRTAYSSTEGVVELFEEQVTRSSEHLALVHREHSVTYAELNRRANRLARHLRVNGVGSGQLVAICLERGIDMVVCLLGALKAGAAYMPLDPNYPVQRLRFMLEDSSPSLLLTQAGLVGALSLDGTRGVLIEELCTLEKYDCDNLSAAQVERNPWDLVYVIYTSGSTGQPKGTAMTHHAVVNLLHWHRDALPLNHQRVLQFAALSFDVAFQEIFSTLCGGGTLVLTDEQTRRDVALLAYLITRERVERLFIPPLMLQALAEHFCATGSAPQCLREVITAGEQLRISTEIIELFDQLPDCTLSNHYGPTETHVVTALNLKGNAAQWPTLPSIGRPIANAQVYILDDARQPVPIEVAGQIFIGGRGLARAYLNRPSLTAERFTASPFNSEASGRLYATGDLGRWKRDGSIEYLGRNDGQVKIRGFRVEVGDIELHMATHPAVRDVAVVARDDGPAGKRLVAYVTVTDRFLGVPSTDSLRDHLRSLVPEHMVPSAFVVLDKMPTTPTGKLNRRGLPAPDASAHATVHYEPVRGRVEQVIAAVWGSLLGVEQVGREDDFFELGGHSLLVIKAVSKINTTLGSTLSVADVYKAPKLKRLAALIENGSAQDYFIDLSREAVIPEDIVPVAGRRLNRPCATLLTGAAGFVGRFLLAELLQRNEGVIHCLVRARNDHEAASRVKRTLVAWELWQDDFAPRIRVIAADLRASRLGLRDQVYAALCNDIDCIYHCATSMNHLETYESAKASNVEGSLELLRLATRGRPKVINYISTLGVFTAPSDGVARVVNEDSGIDNERHQNSRGYVASKWVGEKIFMLASERGFACNVFRLGLVWADTLRGRYDELQRGYRIVKSCLLSGYGIENFTYEMVPTPVDYVARAVVQLGNDHSSGGGIFHIASPAQMSDGLFERCNELLGTELELLPWYRWIAAIKRLHAEGCSLPVVPLVEFAFSMTESEFAELQRRLRSATVIYDCTRTYRELEKAGIVAPVLDDQLLTRCVDSMLTRDPDLRGGCETRDEGTSMMAREGRRRTSPLERRVGG